jgi:lysophospholipase L1-like esterase
VKRLATPSILGAAALAACLALSACGDKEPVSAVGKTRLVAFGHSYVMGRYPDPSITPYPEQVGAALGWEVSNRGVSGTTSDQVEKVVDQYDVSPADTVTIQASLNDVGYRGRGGLERYGKDLRGMLDHLTGGDIRPRQVIVMGDPPVIAWNLYKPVSRGSNLILKDYVALTKRIAKEYRVTYVDLGQGWDPAADLSPIDHIHPGASGTKKIRDKLVRAIRQSLRQGA